MIFFKMQTKLNRKYWFDVEDTSLRTKRDKPSLTDNYFKKFQPNFQNYLHGIKIENYLPIKYLFQFVLLFENCNMPFNEQITEFYVKGDYNISKIEIEYTLKNSMMQIHIKKVYDEWDSYIGIGFFKPHDINKSSIITVAEFFLKINQALKK